VIGWGVIRTRGDLKTSLLKIRDEMRKILENYYPERAVMEAIIYNKNPKIAILLGAVRGVLLVLFGDFGLEITEVPPSRLKLAATRRGRASKHQVAHVLKLAYGLNEDVPDHVSDALAAAHYILK